MTATAKVAYPADECVHDLGEHGEYITSQIRDLLHHIVEKGLCIIPAQLIPALVQYAIDFTNDTFTAHPSFESCLCEPAWGHSVVDEHKPDCILMLPNFECGDIMITWSKYIGRGMQSNKQLTRAQWRELFNKCHRSLES